MRRGRVYLLIGAVVVSAGILAGIEGCAEKRVASTAGDQSSTAREKGAAAQPEPIRQEPMVSVEPPLSGLVESKREMGAGQPAPSSPGSGSVPSGRAMPGGQEAAAAADQGGLGDIFFDFDKYNIRGDAQPVLDGNGRVLRSEQKKSVLIEGHCDERGTMAYNLVLGEKRAKAAKRYLEELGVPGARLRTISYGEIRPFCKEHNEGCWQKNRRAHFVVQ